MNSSLFKKAAVSAAVIALLSGCAQQSAHTLSADKTYKLTILHTNDNHGHFWQNAKGEYGMAARKTIIDRVRKEVKAEGGSVLLLSTGDVNTGVPESDLLDAEPDIKGMNLMGYDAMAIGNHEFDNPLSVLAKQQGWAHFPMLSANIYNKTTGKRVFKPYIILHKQGIKIAVIGLTTEDTVKVGNPDYVKNLDFRDPKVETKKLVAELKETEHPDMIIAVAHMGHYDDAHYGINAPGDVSLARYLPKQDIDLIVGGHTHDAVCMQDKSHIKVNYQPGDMCKPDLENGIEIVQAFEWGKYVGRADYEFHNGQVNLVSYHLIPVNLKKKVQVNGESKSVYATQEIPQDPAMLKLLQPYQDKGQVKLGQKVATVTGKLEGDRKVVRFHQTNLGRLIATAHMERTKADFAIMNSGGVRSSITPGDVTYKSVLMVQPFSNTITYIDMSGSDVKKYLDKVATKPVDSGAYPQFAGISMVVGKRSVSQVKIHGKPLDPSKTYRFSVPSYNAAGGDGYPKITDHKGFVDTGFVDAEVLKAYLHSHSPVDASQYIPHGEIIYKL
ncbi:bifunctional UDP-sugar hydrolase/5'-nucleotidase [Vibrio sp. CAIM 722]|uniref:Bifunctional UDP-sugar hydrolase/5'-nucleotidase n=1 Tax=Vibrio eleionomae TaxID=2653505 RepID=A0A7X4LHG4_9VIBR|nr:bifunctional UDP-sugar hydrolase/5'-nucleotidase UshA [Vibrio eleionomae]MZI92028.1 bifunctional UDP-sugar hydrolase/5'-nucleotidase [Vibrio eleionomae]